MIKELPISGFDTKLSNSSLNYPQSKNLCTPRFFFNMLAVASRGEGKTHNVVKLIREYEVSKCVDNEGIEHPIRTFVISPTIDANKIFQNLKSLSEEDTYSEYSEEILQGIIDDIQLVNEEIIEYNEYKEAYLIIDRTPLKKIKDLLTERPELFQILKQYDFQHYKSIPPPRYYEKPINLIVLDDLMSSSCFNRKQQSLLANLLIKNRHHQISFLILVQALKAVPKNIRCNCNVFYLGKFASKKYILEDIYTELSNIMTIEQFEEIYDYSVKEKHGGLLIDTSGDKKRFYKALDSELVFSE